MRLFFAAILAVATCFAGEITPTRVVKLDVSNTTGKSIRARFDARPNGAFVSVKQGSGTDVFGVDLKGEVKRQQASGRFQLDEYGTVASAPAAMDETACSTVGLDTVINGHGDFVVNGKVLQRNVGDMAELTCGSGIAVMWYPNGTAFLVDGSTLQPLPTSGSELDVAQKHYAHLPPSDGYGFVTHISITSPVDVWAFYAGPTEIGIPAVHFVNGERAEKVTLRLPKGVRSSGRGAIRGGFAVYDPTTMSVYIFEGVAQ